MQQFVNWGSESPEQKAARARWEEEQYQQWLNRKLFEARRGSSSQQATAAVVGGGSVQQGIPNMWCWVMQGPNETSKLWMVNVTTGERVLIGSTDKNYLVGLAVDPNSSRLFAMSGGDVGRKLWTVNTENGEAEAIGVTDISIPDITIGADNVLRGWTETGDNPISINKQTGEVTVTSSSLSSYETGVANSIIENCIMVKVSNDLNRVDYTTGAYSLVCSYDIPNNGSNVSSFKNSMSNSPITNKYIAITRDEENNTAEFSNFYLIDEAGNVTYLSTVPFGVSGVAYHASTFEVNGTPSADWQSVSGGEEGSTGAATETSAGVWKIVGSNGGTESIAWNYIKKHFTGAARITIKYKYSTVDENQTYDYGFYNVDPHEPTGEPGGQGYKRVKFYPENGSWQILVPYGWVSIGIYSTDDVSGPGTIELEITEEPLTLPASSGSIVFSGLEQGQGGAYIASPNYQISDWLPGTGDYTVEWFQYQTAAGHPRVFSIGPDTAAKFGVSIEGDTLYTWPNGNSWVIGTYLNEWHHYALVRKDNVTRLYVDGQAVGTGQADTNDIANTVYDLYIGSDGLSQGDSFEGKITNFRWTNSAVYLANFSPVTSPLSALAQTKLLLLGGSDLIQVVDSSQNNILDYQNTEWSSSTPF